MVNFYIKLLKIVLKINTLCNTEIIATSQFLNSNIKMPLQINFYASGAKNN